MIGPTPELYCDECGIACLAIICLEGRHWYSWPRYICLDCLQVAIAQLTQPHGALARERTA